MLSGRFRESAAQRAGGRCIRVALGLLLLATLGGPARAAGVASLIEWEAPEGCAGALEVHARLAGLLGREPETLGKLSRVRGTVLRSAHGYRLVLETLERERRSSRVFEANTCAELTDAAALALALALAPDAVAAEDAGAPDSSATANTHVHRSDPLDGTDPGAEVADPPSPESPGTPVRGFAAAAVVVESGALPRLAPGLTVGTGIDWGRLTLGGYGSIFGTQTLSVAPGQSVEFDWLAAGARGCYALHVASPRVNVCAVFELGRFGAFGLDLQPARRVRELWLAAGAAADVRWPLSRALQVELRAEPMLPLGRKQYTVNRSDEVHAPGALSARLYLGLLLSGG